MKSSNSDKFSIGIYSDLGRKIIADVMIMKMAYVFRSSSAATNRTYTSYGKAMTFVRTVKKFWKDFIDGRLTDGQGAFQIDEKKKFDIFGNNGVIHNAIFNHMDNESSLGRYILNTLYEDRLLANKTLNSFKADRLDDEVEVPTFGSVFHKEGKRCRYDAGSDVWELQMPETSTYTVRQLLTVAGILLDKDAATLGDLFGKGVIDAIRGCPQDPFRQCQIEALKKMLADEEETLDINKKNIDRECRETIDKLREEAKLKTKQLELEFAEKKAKIVEQLNALLG